MPAREQWKAQMTALESRSFAPSDAEVVSRWAVTPADALAWCSMNTVPVDPSVVAGWSQAPGVAAYVMLDGTDLVAYGEIWIDVDGDEAELGHLIVAPRHRGRSVGRQITRALATIAGAASDNVFLRVRPENAAARRCYEAAGFVRVPADDESQWNQGQPVDYVWMRAVSST